MKALTLIALLPLIMACSDARERGSENLTPEHAHEFLKAAFEKEQAVLNAEDPDTSLRMTYSGDKCRALITKTRTAKQSSGSLFVVTSKYQIQWNLVTKVSAWEFESKANWRVTGPILFEQVNNFSSAFNSTGTKNYFDEVWHSFEDSQRIVRAMEAIRVSCDKLEKFAF